MVCSLRVLKSDTSLSLLTRVVSAQVPFFTHFPDFRPIRLGYKKAVKGTFTLSMWQPPVRISLPTVDPSAKDVPVFVQDPDFYEPSNRLDFFPPTNGSPSSLLCECSSGSFWLLSSPPRQLNFFPNFFLLCVCLCYYLRFPLLWT